MDNNQAPIEENKNVPKDSLIKMKCLYSRLRDLIRNNTVIFMCNGIINSAECNSVLFVSDSIEGFYAADISQFSFLLNHLPNLTYDPIISNEDEDLKQSDCIFQKVLCSNCQSVIGRHFRSVSLEKEYLLDKTVVFARSLIAVQENFSDCTSINIKDVVQINPKESEEIKEYCQVNLNLKECLETIENLVYKTKEYLKMKNNIINTEKFAENLSRLSKYIEYLLVQIYN